MSYLDIFIAVVILMRVCTKCVLPETFPGVKFNEEGVCNHCLKFKGQEKLAEQKEKYKTRFRALFDEHRGKGTYDCLMCYSGGKDSTYTLCMLKNEYNARILAVTLDNWFISERALKNIQSVIETLDVDHYFVKPRFEVLRRIFTACSSIDLYPGKMMERASAICTSCMGLVKFISLRLAIEKGIPFIAYGWSPGQAPLASSIFKTNPSMTKVMQETIKGPLSSLVGDAIVPYFLEDEHFNSPDRFPYNISPLIFMDYDKGRIFHEIRKLGWEPPDDTDANTTNCLLNSYANTAHIERFGYHPYSFEIASLVRRGIISRDEGLKRLNDEGKASAIAFVKRKLEKR